jgi:toxin-antitoxin system PIN domain toxin
MPDSPAAWLLDGSVLVALSLASHVHHERARKWFAARREPFATCATTQGTLLRIHMQTALDGSATAAWAALRSVCAHRDHVFWEERLSYLDVSSAGLTGPRQVPDAWLATLAARHQSKVATLDAAFAAAHPRLVQLLP